MSRAAPIHGCSTCSATSWTSVGSRAWPRDPRPTARPAAAARDAVPEVLAGPDDLRLRRQRDAPRPPDRGGAHPPRGPRADGPPHGGRAAPAFAVLAARRRLARSRPQPTPADDPVRSRAGGGNRGDSAGIPARAAAARAAVRDRLRGRLAERRLRHLLEHPV